MRELKTSKVSKAIALGLMVICAPSGYSYAQSNEQTDQIDTVERISVLGSRIKKETFESASPVTIISAETLKDTGFSNLEEALSDLPQLAIGTNLGNTSNGTTAGNLRGAGVNRTLTLINGKRVVASSIYGTTVDLSTIPIGMVEQVEILTGGASAVYGSDALAGVINIKLKKDYEGFKVSANFSVPEKGGAEAQQFSLSMGGSFAGGRGNINAGINYSNSEPLQQKDRDFVSGKGLISSVSNPLSKSSTDGIPDYIIVNDLHTGTYPATGGLRTYNWETYQYDNYYIDPNTGELTFNDKTFYGQYTSGGPGFAFGEYAYQLRGAQDVLSTMINLNYEMSDSIDFYSTIQLSKSNSSYLGQMAYTPTPITVHRENPTLPQSVRDFMDAKNWNEITANSDINRWDFVYRTHEDFGRQGNKSRREFFSAIFGFTGQLMSWDWDLSFQHGTSDMTQTRNRLYKDRHDFAFDVVEDEQGNAVCRATLEGNPAAKGCLPLAIFGENTDQEAIDWVKAVAQSSSRNEQTIISGYISGELIELPAGFANVVFGSEYREEIIESVPDSATYAGNILLAGLTPPIEPSSLDVIEYFTEIDVPILDNLSLNGSYRYSDYSTIGSVDAWGLGIDYQIIEDIKFRASASESVRAPSVYDLFNPGNVTFAFIEDPCNKPGDGNNPAARTENCKVAVGENWVDPLSTASRAVRSGGNSALKPEDAETLTAGFVFTPSFAPDLNISIDWWKMELTNEITTVSVTQLLKNCYDTQGLDSSACAAITRRADGAISEIKGGSINVGNSLLSGIDYEIEYSFDANQLIDYLDGSFLTTVIVNQWLDKYEISDPNEPIESFTNYKGNYYYPDYLVNFTVAYNTDDWGVKFRGNLRDSSVADADYDHTKGNYDEVYPNGNGVAPMIKRFDFISHYKLSDSAYVNFSIRNLLDEEPPRTTGLNGGLYGVADVIGRTYNIGITVEM